MNLAIVSLCAPAAGASLTAKPSIVNGLPGEPAFQQDSASSPVSYLWRNQGVVATFQEAGAVFIRLSNGKQVRLHGADIVGDAVRGWQLPMWRDTGILH
jgi:hypothetical protein